MGELEDVGAAAGAQDAAHFAQARKAIGEIAQAEGDGDGVVAGGAKGRREAHRRQEDWPRSFPARAEAWAGRNRRRRRACEGTTASQSEQDVATAGGEIKDAGGSCCARRRGPGGSASRDRVPPESE